MADRQRSLDIPIGPTDELRERMAARRRARIEREYAELRELDIDLFRECVQSATTIGLNHHLEQRLGNAAAVNLSADVEAALVSMTLRGLRG